MFMGNGEQYIWKPPEDEEMLMHQNKVLGPLGAHTVENIQPSAAVVSQCARPSPVCHSVYTLNSCAEAPCSQYFPSNVRYFNITQNMLCSVAT